MAVAAHEEGVSMIIYHIILSLLWRVALIASYPLLWLGEPMPALWAAFHVMHHDEKTIT